MYSPRFIALYSRTLSSIFLLDLCSSASSTEPMSSLVLWRCWPSSRSAADRFLTFLLCAVKISDLFLDGRGRPAADLFLAVDELEISDARFVENASEADEDISLVLVFEACFTP